MSEHQFQSLVNELHQRRKPMDRLKLLVMLFGFAGTIFTIGVVSGGWQNFRIKTEKFMDEKSTVLDRHETAIQLLQDDKNWRRRIYNDTVGNSRNKKSNQE